MLQRIKSMLGFETRNFTEQVLQQSFGLSSGVGSSGASRTASVEIATGLWARAMAGAQVSPVTMATRMLTPELLAYVGRQLIRQGECVLWINEIPNGLELLPVGSWVIEGSYSPSSWLYRLELFGPSKTGSVVNVGAESVLHFRYAFDSNSPYRGQSPIAFALTSAQLTGEIETRLAIEAKTPAGVVIPVPKDDDANLQEMANSLNTNAGRIQLTETSVGGWDEGRLAAPYGDWRPQRYGANPPQNLVNLRDMVSVQILTACGIPPSLVAINADGTAQRESYRRFVHLSVVPVAKMLSTEIAQKLEIPDFELGFSDLYAADLQSRTRGLKQLVDAGVSLDEAKSLVGLDI